MNPYRYALLIAVGALLGACASIAPGSRPIYSGNASTNQPMPLPDIGIGGLFGL